MKIGSLYKKVLVLFLGISLVCLRGPIFALQEISPSPNPTSSPTTPTGFSEDIYENIQGKSDEIEKVIESIKRQVTQGELKKAACVGEVKEISETSLTLETKNGPREILINDETKVVAAPGGVRTLKNIEAGSYLAALGYLQSESILEAKRIILASKNSSQRKVAVGIISDKSSNEDLFILTPVNDKNTTLEITINEETKILGPEKTPLNYDQIKKGQKTAVIYIQKEGVSTAVLVKVISPDSDNNTHNSEISPYLSPISSGKNE